MIEINSLEDPKISEFINIRDYHAKLGEFVVIESEKPFLRSIESKHRLIKILATKSFLNKHIDLIPSSCGVFFATKKLLEKVVGFQLHHGVFALFERPKNLQVDKLDDHIVATNGISGPENIGMIVRNSVGFNITSFLIDHKSCSPFLRRCARVSIGNCLHSKVRHSENFFQDLNSLKQFGYKVLGLENIESSLSLSKYQWPEKMVLVLGSEGNGIDQEVLNLCDEIVRIDINNQINSLNVACAHSICLHDIFIKTQTS